MQESPDDALIQIQGAERSATVRGVTATVCMPWRAYRMLRQPNFWNWQILLQKWSPKGARSAAGIRLQAVSRRFFHWAQRRDGKTAPRFKPSWGLPRGPGDSGRKLSE